MPNKIVIFFAIFIIAACSSKARNSFIDSCTKDTDLPEDACACVYDVLIDEYDEDELIDIFSGRSINEIFTQEDIEAGKVDKLIRSLKRAARKCKKNSLLD